MPEFDPKNVMIGLFTGLFMLFFVPSHKAFATTMVFEFPQGQEIITLDDTDMEIIACNQCGDSGNYQIEIALKGSGKDKLQNSKGQFVRIYIDGEYVTTIYVDQTLDNNFVITGSHDIVV